MTTFSPNDYIIIGGDFNPRTGVLPDYIHENHKDINFLKALGPRCDFFMHMQCNNDQQCCMKQSLVAPASCACNKFSCACNKT